jgi:transcription elongation factor Elf1
VKGIEYMTAYQVILYDIDTKYTIATYLNQLKAIEHLNTLLKEQQDELDQSIKCYHCPIHKLSKRKYKKNKNKIFDYCKNIREQDFEFQGNNIFCNVVQNDLYLEDNIYQIQEIEIIE